MNRSEHDIDLKIHVIRTLLYYDIFNYPLKSKEVFRFLGTNSITEADVSKTLNALASNAVLFRFDDFYSIQQRVANVQRRLKGNKEAEKYLEIAKQKAAVISRFPFVRGVLASGSLAKGYMDEKSDLDFFIITAPRRLWIARTLLVMYKRLFLFNSHKYFCVNYFVDEDHLEIEEKNLFTATELATVLPLYGAQHYVRFQKVNSWVKGFFPNYIERSVREVPHSSVRGLKKFFEVTFNTLFADKIESYFRGLTLRRWKRLYEKEYPRADFEIAFKSKEYASKNHPQHFQRKVMEIYTSKVKQFDFSGIFKDTGTVSINPGLKH